MRTTRFQRTSFLAAIFIALQIAGCSAVAVEKEGQLEAIYGLTADPTGLTLQVHSSGCTSKEHFNVQKLDGDPAQILFLRVKRDLCRAYLPYGRTLSWTYAELGVEPGQRLQVMNPLAAIRTPRQ